MAAIAHASAVIEAPITHVWSIMKDLGRYGEWNPFVTHLELERPGAMPVPGEVVFLYSRWMDTPDGALRKTRGVLTRFIEPAEVATSGVLRSALLEYRFAEWMAVMRLVLATRQQSLTELADGRTEYVSHEEFRGLLGDFVPLRRVQAGFDAHAAALKAYAERTFAGR